MRQSPTRQPAPSEAEFVERYVNREQARRTFGPLADRYARFYLEADPVADALADAIAERRVTRAQVDSALRKGLPSVSDPAPELRAFIEAVETVPAWVDFALLNEGARVYQRLGPAAMFILSAWSLMNGYHSAPAVKPLMWTRQLDKMAPRRLAETGRFVIETVEVDGLRRYHEGFRIAAHVRVMHATVRRMILASGDWNTAAWGLPINQADMAGTTLEFSALVLRGAEAMGFLLSKRDQRAIMHLWRYSGYLSGVHPDLLAELSSLERTENFANLIYSIQPGPDADSIALAAALRRVPASRSRNVWEERLAELVMRYHDGLTYAFNGDEIASSLEVPNPEWRHVIHLTRALVVPMEVLRRVTPGMNRVATRLGRKILRMNVEDMLAGKEPGFEAKRASTTASAAA